MKGVSFAVELSPAAFLPDKLLVTIKLLPVPHHTSYPSFVRNAAVCVFLFFFNLPKCVIYNLK